MAGQHLRDLRVRLGRFAEGFPRLIDEIETGQIDKSLGDLRSRSQQSLGGEIQALGSGLDPLWRQMGLLLADQVLGNRLRTRESIQPAAGRRDLFVATCTPAR